MPHSSLRQPLSRAALAFLALMPSALSAQTRDPLVEAKSLFEARQPASTAAAMLKREHRSSLDQSATLLRNAGYSARSLLPALRAEFAPTLSAMYASLKQAGFAPSDISDAFAGNMISLDCIDPQGFAVPCGNFGGTADASAMGQVSWSPKPEGVAGATLQISASNLPSVYVKIGAQTLGEISTGPGTMTVRLPASPTTGTLTLVRKSDNVSGLLQHDYRVVAPPVPWMSWSSAATAGAIAEMKRWMSGARIMAGCVVNGPIANAAIGAFTSSNAFAGDVKTQLLAAGAPAALAHAWDTAFRAAFSTYTANVTIPALPLFPSLAAVAAKSSPEVTSQPTPLALFLSVGAVGMQTQALVPSVGAAIAPVSVDEPARSAAVAAFATAVAGKFNLLLAQGIVVGLKASGAVPKYSPPAIPSAPVENGSCKGTAIVMVPPVVF